MAHLLTKTKLSSLAQATALCLLVLGCGSNSDVGNQKDLPPIAKATAVGVGANNQVREGQEFILTAKDSDGVDAPIFEFNWQVSSGSNESLLFKELSVNSVSVTAPKVIANTDIVFQLDVIDADGGTASDSVTVTVVPGRDKNKFLSYDAINDAELQTYQVTLQPQANTVVDESNSQIDLNISASVSYPDRQATCRFDGYDSSGLVCLNYLNNANVSLEQGDQSIQVEWNVDDQGHATDTTIELQLPEFILSQFNQTLLDAGADREQLLETWKADDIGIFLDYTLDSMIEATVVVNGVNGGQPVVTTDSAGTETRSYTSPFSLTIEQIRNSGAGLVESKFTAQQYYDMIDPLQEADTLNKWLVSAGFASENPDGSITLLEEGLVGENTEDSDFAHALYTNNFDLGFGRDMYVRVDDQGNVYSYVTNYATLEAAAKKLSPIATVVMEYTRPRQGDGTEPRFVKFYTYIPDESGEQIRATDFDFDGRGQKYMPGVCTACHGGKPKDIAEAIGTYSGDIQASFLPWDLDSFLYTDTDPAITEIAEVELDPSNLVYSRAAQQEQFRKLNQSVFHIYNSENNSRFDAVTELIGGTDNASGWYSEIECAEDSRSLGCLEGEFYGEAVPEGWQDNSELYLDVVARHCRGCHLVQQGSDEVPALFQMATADDFLADEHAEKVRNLVFKQGSMPLARLTMDRLWAGTQSNPNPGQILWDGLQESGTVVPPGAPTPQVDYQAQANHSVTREANGQEYLLTKTGRTIEFDASNSGFTDSFEWQLLESTSIPGFESCLADSQALTSNGASATLTPSLANTSAQYYCLQLTASNDITSKSAPIIFVQVVDNRLPEVAFTSQCDSAELCLSVSEVNSDTASSIISLSASIQESPLAFTDPDCNLEPTNICSNVNTLIHIIDQDIIDGLDPPSTISFELTNILSFGGLNERSFDLSQLLQGDSISYQATVDEVGAQAQSEIFQFNIYDNGILIEGIAPTSIEIEITPVSDNSPTFGSVQNTSVDFSQQFNSNTFVVNDADGDDVTLSLVQSSLGTVTVDEVSSTATSSTYDYQFTDNSARDIGASTSLCSTFGVFNGQQNGVFQILADDGSDAPDVPVVRNVSVSLTTSLDFSSVAAAYASKTTTGGSRCDSCHGTNSAVYPDWVNELSILRDNVSLATNANLTNPESSNIFTKGAGAHTGGAFTFSFANTVDRNMLEWIYQCAPN